MIIVIDAGNTNTTFALIDSGAHILFEWRVQNDPSRTRDEYASLLLPLFEHKKIALSSIKGALLCSVVPAADKELQAFIKKYLNLTLHNVNQPDIKLSVTSLVDRPEAVGNDRLVTFVGASRLYGGPLLVIDFGTATTFDFTDEKGNHLGGVIAPGASLVAQSLSQGAALLPNIPIEKPSSVIGTWTIPQMQTGIYYGYIGLFEGIIQRLLEEFPSTYQTFTTPPKVVVTGGLASLFQTDTSLFDIMEPALLLKGLYYIYEDNFGSVS